MTVAYWLSQHDDVRDDARSFKAPKMCADAAVAGLHFIGNANAAGLAHSLIHLREIAIGKNNLAANAGQGFANEARERAQLVSNINDMLRVLFGSLRIIAAI